MLLAQQVIANRIDNAYRHKDKAKQEGSSKWRHVEIWYKNHSCIDGPSNSRNGKTKSQKDV